MAQFRDCCAAKPEAALSQKTFNDPVYLLFLQSMLPSFTHCNQFLQREKPLIHVLQPQLENMLKGTLAKFVKPAALVECLQQVGYHQ